MASTFSPNKRIESPGHGDRVDAWDQPINSNWAIIDAALGGMVVLNVTGLTAAPVTLTPAQYQPPYIAVTGTLSANVTLVIPAGVGGAWIVGNYTTGSFTLRFVSGGVGGQNVVVPTNARTEILSDGSNVVISVNTSVPSGPNGAVQLNENGFFYGTAGVQSDGNNLSVATSITAGSSLNSTSLSLTAPGTATIAGGVTAAALRVTGGTQLDSGPTIGTAAAGETDLFFRTAYGTVYPYATSSGTWGVYDPQVPRNRFSTNTAGDMTVTGNFGAANVYLGTSSSAQAGNMLAYNTTYFSWTNNQSYYAVSVGDWDYVFHSSDGWRSQYQKSTGSFLWVAYSGVSNLSLDGSGNLTVRSALNVNGNMATPNAVTAGYMHSTGSMNVDGTMQAGTVNSSNNINVGYDAHVSNYTYTGGLYVYGDQQTNGNVVIGGNVNISGGLGVNGSIGASINIGANNSLFSNNNILLPNAYNTQIFSGGGGLAFSVNAQPFAFHAAGYAWNNGGWIGYSSREGKKDLLPIAGALALTLAITGYNFTDTITGQRRMGVVAEEIEAILPQAVRQITLFDGKESIGVDHGGMVSALFPQVTRELVTLITEQASRIAALEARLQAAGL